MNSGSLPSKHLFRPGRVGDAPALEALIRLSVQELQAATYSAAQREAALGPVFGVDRDLLEDGTCWVVESDGKIVACGSWSWRRALFGGSTARSPEAGGQGPRLDPAREAARIQAFFVHPAWARRGLGRALLLRCEAEALAQGFREAELVATLAGEPLYAAGGYEVTARYEVPLGNGLALPVVKMRRTLAQSLLVSESNSR